MKESWGKPWDVWMYHDAVRKQGGKITSQQCWSIKVPPPPAAIALSLGAYLTQRVSSKQQQQWWRTLRWVSTIFPWQERRWRSIKASPVDLQSRSLPAAVGRLPEWRSIVEASMIGLQGLTPLEEGSGDQSTLAEERLYGGALATGHLRCQEGWH